MLPKSKQRTIIWNVKVEGVMAALLQENKTNKELALGFPQETILLVEVLEPDICRPASFSYSSFTCIGQRAFTIGLLYRKTIILLSAWGTKTGP